MSTEDIRSRIIARTWQDKSFKQKLLDNPVETLTQEGVLIPDGIEVTVFEETPTSFAIVLPTNKQELSDSDLESIAGGKASIQGIGIDVMWD